MLLQSSFMRFLVFILPMLALSITSLSATMTLDNVLEKSDLKEASVHFKITDADHKSIRCAIDGIEACIALDTYFKAMKDDSKYGAALNGYYLSRNMRRLEFSTILFTLNRRSSITLRTIAWLVDTFMYALEKTKNFTYVLKTRVPLDDESKKMIEIFSSIRRTLALGIDECRWWLIDLHERVAEMEVERARKKYEPLPLPPPSPIHYSLMAMIEKVVSTTLQDFMKGGKA